MSLERWRGDWTALAERSRNVFSTWEFADVWWRHFGGSRTPHVVEGDGFLLPLYLWRARPRVLRLIGHGPADELGPVCAPDDRGRAAAELRRVLGAAGGVLLAERFAGDADWSVLGGRLVSRESSRVLRFETRDWDAYLATRSGSFRSGLRRSERSLHRDHDVVVRETDAAQLEDDLRTLLRLHAERWGGGTTSFDEHEAFHLDFSRVAFERGWLRLWILEVDGEPAAAWHGYRYANVESYYQAGRARKFDELRVGAVLLAHTIRAAQADGIDEYRFLRGDESFKARFTDEDPGIVTLAVGSGPLADGALAAAVAARNVRRALATRLRRSPRTAPPAGESRPAG
jgi:hypothetical protein